MKPKKQINRELVEKLLSCLPSEIGSEVVALVQLANYVVNAFEALPKEECMKRYIHNINDEVVAAIHIAAGGDEELILTALMINKVLGKRAKDVNNVVELKKPLDLSNMTWAG